MKPIARLAAAALLLAAAPAHAAGLCQALQTVLTAGTSGAFDPIRRAPFPNDPGTHQTSAPLPGFARCQIIAKAFEYSCFTTGMAAAQASAMAVSVKGELEACAGPMADASAGPIQRWTLRAAPGSFPLITLETAAGQVALTVTMRG